jgi:hypothetical protein
MAGGIAVHGRAELLRAFAAAEKDERKFLREAERRVAEPVRLDAESLARATIPRIGLAWSQMRIGITQRSVYVAPKQRGTRRRDDPRSRRNLGTLLMDRAMQPALERHEHEIAAAYEREVIDRMAARFNR